MTTTIEMPKSLESYLAGEWSRKNESPGYTAEEVAAFREKVAKRRSEIFGWRHV